MSEGKAFSEEFEERQAQREAELRARQEELAKCGLDGPYKIEQGGGLFGGFMSPSLFEYALCVGIEGEWPGCGAMIKLGDAMERPGQQPVERGVNLHCAFHYTFWKEPT